ncbi:hypothetical protein EKK58_05875 [Candidatus Dependentiae bacterium]|nr:MAG: hypothetical protein EKK58_05875 [Candidatus Dependentiae bacterium]
MGVRAGRDPRHRIHTSCRSGSTRRHKLAIWTGQHDRASAPHVRGLLAKRRRLRIRPARRGWWHCAIARAEDGSGEAEEEDPHHHHLDLAGVMYDGPGGRGANRDVGGGSWPACDDDPSPDWAGGNASMAQVAY